MAGYLDWSDGDEGSGRGLTVPGGAHGAGFGDLLVGDALTLYPGRVGGEVLE
jgi:hypothetical protein